MKFSTDDFFGEYDQIISGNLNFCAVWGICANKYIEL